MNIKKIALAISFGLVLLAATMYGVLSVAEKTARWFDSNTLEVRSPIVLRKPVVVEKREELKPIVEKVYIKEPSCEWSRECVEAYIDFVAKGNTAFADWAKFVSLHEGGYKSQLSQQNWADSHSNGEKGSFGQFQFGKGTYFDHCEESDNWQMDWKAQTRCAKTIWDKGIAHNTWWNTTNKYLSEKGLSKLASNQFRETERLK